MESEGVELEHTGEVSKLCTKPDYYEIVKIKNGIPDDTKISDFRHCPSWKAICITILKNDFTLQYMSVSRSKKDMDRRNKIMNKYRKLL
jgi:predicted phosphoadenosine phosphosulfate sulfurtransferase